MTVDTVKPNAETAAPVFEGSAELLVNALRFVKHAISDEETRYYLRSVCFDIRDKIHVVATDGHRLAHTTLPFGVKGYRGKFILKREDALAILGKYKSKKSLEGVRFTLDAGSKRLTIGAAVFDDADVTYVDWQRVLPRDTKHLWSFPRDLVSEVASRFTGTSRRGCGAAVKIVGSEDGVLEMTASEPVSTRDTWRTVAFTSAAKLEGQNIHAPFEFGVDSRYLSEALAAFAFVKNAKQIELTYNGDGWPMRLHSGVDADSFVAIMPCRV